MKKGSKKKAAEQAADQLLTNGRINKSELIREYAKANADAKPSAIAAALGTQTGQAFSPALVSQVLTKAKASGPRRGRAPTVGQSEFAVLLQVKSLADKIGGVEVVKNAVAALDKLLT